MRVTYVLINRWIQKLICVDADQSLPDHVPPVATLRQIFTRYLDFNAVPRRSFFQLLRRFTSDELEQETLDDFLSKEGAVRLLSNILGFLYQIWPIHRMISMNIVFESDEPFKRS